VADTFSSPAPLNPSDVLTALGLAAILPQVSHNRPAPGNPSLFSGMQDGRASMAPQVTESADPVINPPPIGLPPPPTVPPGANPATQGMAPSPAVTMAMPPMDQPQVPPGILAALGMYEPDPPPPNPNTAAIPMTSTPSAAPGPSGLAPAVEPLGPTFPGGSFLQNLGIDLPRSASPAPGGSRPGPSSSSPTGPGPASPPGGGAPSLAPQTQPEPSGGRGSTGPSGDSGRGASRLLDTLAVIGTVLSQPPPPGGNLVSQIGRAMGMGFMYNKMLDSAEVEQTNTAKKQELENRRTAVQEKQVGITGRRVDQQGRLVDIEERKAPAEIELLRARATAAGLETRFKEIELQFKNDPARRELEMRKLAAEVDNIGARTDLTRNQVETPQSQAQAREAKALKDAGALDPMSPTGINWRVAGPVLAGMGYRPLGAADVQAAKAKYQELIKSGITPIEAEHQLNMYLRSKRYVPVSLAPTAR